MEVYGPGASGQHARNQFCRHEGVVRHVELAGESERGSRYETEAWIVRRMADDEDGCDA